MIKDRLIEFTKVAASVSFEYGKWDCGLTMANWVHFNWGIDPAVDIRGTYHNDFGWKRMAIREGGLHEVINKRLKAVGMKIVEPQIGDVGPIIILQKTVVGFRQACVGAIRGDDCWIVKLNKGIAMVQPFAMMSCWGFR